MTTKSKLIWSVAALFYLTSFFNRTLFSGVIPEVSHTFRVSIMQIGLLSAYMYFVIALVQPFTGIILDRFHIKPVLGFSSLVMTLGLALLAFAHHLYMLDISRVIVGFGGAFAFVGCLKVNSLFFEKKYLGLLSGGVLFVGTLGALLGETPFTFLVTHLGWHVATAIMATFSLIVTLMIFLFISYPKEKLNLLNTNEYFKQYRLVFKKSSNWWLILYCAGMTAPASVVLALWGADYLHVTSHFSIETSSILISFGLIGLCAGSLIVNFLAYHIAFQKLLMCLCSIVGAVVSLLFVYDLQLSYFLLMILLFIFGLVTAGLMIPFTIVAQSHEHYVIAAMSGLINSAAMVLSGALQVAAGFLLRHFSQHIDKTLAYQHAFFIVPLFFILAFMVAVVLAIRL